MKSFRAVGFFAFLTFSIVVGGCVGDENANNNGAKSGQNSNPNTSSSPAKDDVEEFNKVVTVAIDPDEVIWREIPTEKGKRLVAVLKYSSADAQTVAAQAEKHRAPLNGELDAEDWFPPELIAKSQASGDEILKGKNYAANDFFSESYKNGKLTRIDGTDYFVLELTN